MAKRESLYHKYPDYRVDLEPNPARLRARIGEQVIADSARSLTVRETRHEPVSYFPREDVRMDLLEPSEHESFCPFKGEASYFSARLADRVEPDLVWTYERPFDEVAGLKGYVCFYGDRVTIEHV